MLLINYKMKLTEIEIVCLLDLIAAFDTDDLHILLRHWTTSFKVNSYVAGLAYVLSMDVERAYPITAVYPLTEGLRVAIPKKGSVLGPSELNQLSSGNDE
jgi:hypothetical protein